MDKKQIRGYAKEQAPLERAALATEVKELRKAYFDRRRPLPDQILQLEELMEKHKLELDTLISEIGSAKTALRVLKSNKIVL
jgi:antitoxin component HigA of HigAB toxin-antitoxin module